MQSASSSLVSWTPIISYELIKFTNSGVLSFFFSPQTLIERIFKLVKAQLSLRTCDWMLNLSRDTL